MKYYVVDTFTNEVFRGNQAGVCLLDREISDEVMQSIASENNLSETAFFIEKEGVNYLRWFTPDVEIDLCGHATLATAYVIMTQIKPDMTKISFQTMSGELTVEKQGDLFTMYFPTRAPKAVETIVKSRIAPQPRTPSTMFLRRTRYPYLVISAVIPLTWCFTP